MLTIVVLTEHLDNFLQGIEHVGDISHARKFKCSDLAIKRSDAKSKQKTVTGF